MSRRGLWATLIIFVLLAWGSVTLAFALGWEPKLGLDLQGGFAVTLKVPEEALEGQTDAQATDVLETAATIMNNRIENLGSVQEPQIAVQGTDRILVQLPGVQDRERALEAVGTTGVLSFRPVLDIGPQPLLSPAFFDGTLEPPEEFSDALADVELPPVEGEPPENLDPTLGTTIEDDPTLEVAYLVGQDALVYKVGPAFLTGAGISSAEAGFIGGSGLGQSSAGWVVDPAFNSEGAAAFEAGTAELSVYGINDPRRQMAIVVDGEVVSAPRVDPDLAPGEPLDAGQVFITVGGAENAEAEAEDLATILRYGALPTTFERERVESVSATLGSDSLRAGLAAGLGGLLLVGLAMLIYYRALGLVAAVGLTVFGSLLLFVISMLGQTQGTTLTLAGVTGIIVAIGITSDSYIVFFERIKEEHRRGRPLRTAVDHGFKRAFRTILTADFVTFAGSAILFTLAIGPVKGFALTLGLATVIDVLVAYFYTRPAVMLMVRSRLGEGGVFSVRGAMGRTADETEPEPLEVPA